MPEVDGAVLLGVHQAGHTCNVLNPLHSSPVGPAPLRKHNPVLIHVAVEHVHRRDGCVHGAVLLPPGRCHDPIPRVAGITQKTSAICYITTAPPNPVVLAVVALT